MNQRGVETSLQKIRFAACCRNGRHATASKCNLSVCYNRGTLSTLRDGLRKFWSVDSIHYYKQGIFAKRNKIQENVAGYNGPMIHARLEHIQLCDSEALVHHVTKMVEHEQRSSMYISKKSEERKRKL
jgi:hypothetical protein